MQIGLLATFYLLGQAVGALLFGLLADRFGRRPLFFVTLGVYMFGSVLTAAIFGVGESTLIALYLTRFVAGMGIGGEYTAINSMIDELIPAPIVAGPTSSSTEPTGPARHSPAPFSSRCSPERSIPPTTGGSRC